MEEVACHCATVRAMDTLSPMLVPKLTVEIKINELMEERKKLLEGSFQD
jgi:hypothetical protein